MFGFGCCLLFGVSYVAAANLDLYNVDTQQISVSGISSGAVMATQFHVAYSGEIMGAGIVAGLPFHASGGSLSGALTSMSTPTYSVSTLASTTSAMAAKGTVDATSNMQNDRVYIFAGTMDSVVSPQNGHKIQQYYQEYTTNIKTKFDLAAQHCMPTENYGGPCGTLSSTDYMNRCGYNAAYDLLNFIYGGNMTRPPTPASANGKVMTFSQSEFSGSTGTGSGSSLGTGSLTNNLLGGLTGSSNPLTSFFSGLTSGTSSLMNSYTKLLDTYSKMLNGMMSGNVMNSLLGKRKRLLMTDYLNSLPGMSSLPGLSSLSGGNTLSGLTGLDGSSSGLDDTGYIYVPSGCLDKQTKCRLHIAFHGCKMGRQMIQDNYVMHAGYNEVGEANNIIILYPQAVKTMMNPNGCWDWWGYTDANFDNKNGVQMTAVKAMMDRIAGKSS